MDEIYWTEPWQHPVALWYMLHVDVQRLCVGSSNLSTFEELDYSYAEICTVSPDIVTLI